MDKLNQEWYSSLNKIHNELLDWVEDECDNDHTKIIQNDRMTGVTSLVASLVLNYATNNRNKNILVVSPNLLVSKNMYNLVNDLFESVGVYSSTKNTITIFNGTVIEFISQDRQITKEYDLCVFDAAMRISYSNYSKFAPLLIKKRIITFTSGMVPIEEVDIAFMHTDTIDIPFTIRGMESTFEIIKSLQRKVGDFKNEGYVLGCEKIKDMFKDIL